MTIVELVVAACLVAQPDKCILDTVVVIPGPMTDCVAMAPRLTRVWQEWHPDYLVSRSICQHAGPT
jgi:hypothetical protein